MKTWFDTPQQLFKVLRVLSGVCLVLGAVLSMVAGVQPEIEEMQRGPVSVSNVVTLLSMAVNMVLWSVAWAAFMGLCERMSRGGTAFTEKNSRTLSIIMVCVAAIGGVLCLRGVVDRICEWSTPGLGVVYFAEIIVLPGTFWTVALLAYILRKLLKNAMALEEDQRGVI